MVINMVVKLVEIAVVLSVPVCHMFLSLCQDLGCSGVLDNAAVETCEDITYNGVNCDGSTQDRLGAR